MARSQDTTWLHLAGSDDPSVYAYDRLDQIFSSIPAPEQQHPRLVHFLGKRQKHLALKNIFPHNNFGRWRSRCSVDLRIDTPSIDTSRPLLISDSDIGLSPHNTPRYHYDSNYQKSPLRWYTKELSHADVNDTLQARVVFPFADLICIFVDDFPNLDSVAQKLLRWSLLKASSFRNEVVLPRLLLIAAQLVSRDDFAGFAVGDQAGSLHRAFSSIEVFHLGDESLSPVARYRRLRETVQAQTMEALDDRRQRHQAFSAVHLSALFTKCVEHFALTTSQPFDPTEAARSLSQPASSMTKHISTFVRAATKLWFSRTAIVDYISTAVFMDAFPPNMHLFEPSSMYSHYEDQILDEIGFDLKPDISKAFIDLFQEHLNGYTSIDLRRRCFERHAKVLPSLRSNITCLYCLARCPEHVLPCQHSICDICVQRFAEGLSGAESRFLLRGCELCASNVGREVILKPATAGIRVIAIDGGGTRGAVPLESLCILQDLLGELPLRACFDLALGTSSGKSSGWTDEFKLIAVLGGLITLAMFALNWSPHRCSEAFDTLSRRIFESEQVPRSLYGSLKKYLRCWISDGVYDHTCLEKHLQSIYGHSTPLFGAPHNSISAPSTKCAVTTSTISDGTPYLVSNYNGDGTGRAPQGYELLRPEDRGDEPLIWQAARATSAAPVLFQSFSMASVGAFQDGGLKHNNPSRIACWESRRIWPTVKCPDVFLSCGTGAPVRYPRTRSPQFRNVLIDGFIPRLFRSCMAKADGEIMWDEFVNSLDDNAKKNYFRLNVPLDGAALIDDIEGMGSLRESVRSQPDTTRLSIVQTLLMSCFYFELDSRLRQEGGSIRVRGSIRCRVEPRLMTSALKTAGFYAIDFATDFETISQSCEPENDICSACQRFQKRVTFYVRNIKEPVCIYGRSDFAIKYRISGFPQTMEWFEKQQGLEAVFGNEVHDVPGRLRCETCSMLEYRHMKRQLPRDAIYFRRSKRVRLVKE